jgi:hypothetical protein
VDSKGELGPFVKLGYLAGQRRQEVVNYPYMINLTITWWR